MTIEEIRNLISKAEYGYIGIRADSRDYQIGDVMDNSHQLFQDPQYNDDYTELLYPCVQERVNRAELNFWGVHVHPIVRTVAE